MASHNYKFTLDRYAPSDIFSNIGVAKLHPYPNRAKRKAKVPSSFLNICRLFTELVEFQSHSISPGPC